MSNRRRRKRLASIFEGWENGPDGIQVGEDTVTESYLTRRKRVIASRHSCLDPAQVDFLAQNTSGLFGEVLLSVIDSYQKTGEMIRRPYRPGVCPTNPGDSGVVMERGFYPLQVKMALADYGLTSRYVLPRPSLNRPGLLGFVKDILVLVRHYLKKTLNPDRYVIEFEGFQIIGTKKACVE